jgi:ABC-type transport system substrate-binding protein
VLLLAVLASVAVGCKAVPQWEQGRKILHFPLTTKLGSLDPVRAGTQTAAIAQAPVYEPLFEYQYLVRPYTLKPLLIEAMPEVSDDRLTYTFTLRDDLRFHDAPCLEATVGKGRPVVAQDMVWSLMRMADRSLRPSGWWIFQDRIVGFDAFKARMDQRQPGDPFDWDAPIEGLRALDDRHLEIALLRPFPQFLYVLAMGYAAVVPRECAEVHGEEFGNHAIGTGPFTLDSWQRGVRLRYNRTEGWRGEAYPSEAAPEFVAKGLLEPAGRPMPFIDGLVLDVYDQVQPAWLKFRVGDLDVARVASEFHDSIFDQDNLLRPRFVAEGVEQYNLPLLDYIYSGFNMEDPFWGTPGGDRARMLRQAVSLAYDTVEIDDAFYNGTTVLYDGPIPPGLDGYQPGITSPYRGPQLDRARELLAAAGYPNGEGLPPLRGEVSQASSTVQRAEMVARQLRKVGINYEFNTNSFPELSDKLKRKKAQFFGLAWGADYPDAENFLQLFYGPNGSPGSNNWNYDNPEYNRLYDQSRVMDPGPERTEIYTRMRAILIEDVPSLSSMARTRFYVWNARVKYFQPSEVWYGWLKHVDVDGPRE